MNLTATVFQISPLAFKAACEGDYERFGRDDFGEPIRIERDWHLIYYLLTGVSDLLLLPSGIEIEVMSEYAEVHSPESLLELSHQLDSLVKDRKVQALDLEVLSAKKIYPSNWRSDPRDEVESHIVALAAFVGIAVSRGNGLFVFIA